MPKITIPAVTELANVTAFPDEVQITVTAYDGSFKVSQARELALAIIEAADRAEALDWDDNEENPGLIYKATGEATQVV